MKRLLQASLWYDAPARCPQTASFFGMSTVLDYTMFQALKESERYAECYFLLSINHIYIYIYLYTVPLSEIPASDVFSRKSCFRVRFSISRTSLSGMSTGLIPYPTRPQIPTDVAENMVSPWETIYKLVAFPCVHVPKKVLTHSQETHRSSWRHRAVDSASQSNAFPPWWACRCTRRCPKQELRSPILRHWALQFNQRAKIGCPKSMGCSPALNGL